MFLFAGQNSNCTDLFYKNSFQLFVFSSRSVVDGSRNRVDGRLGLRDGHPVSVVDGHVEELSLSIRIADLQIPRIVGSVN
jgi:hypothetical protein